MKYLLNKGFVVQKIGKKRTIFDPEASMLYTFNETASFMLDRLKRGFAKEEIAASVTKKYHVDESKAAKDLSFLLEDLLEKKILVIKQ